jgi:hypothetical protein
LTQLWMRFMNFSSKARLALRICSVRQFTRLAFRRAKSEECVLMAVGVYLRVSTEEQRERQSIVTQRDFAKRYCDLHQYAIYSEYADDGVTGTLPLEQRSAGIRLLEDARAHRFDQVLVFKLDRLGRDTRLILNAVAELEKHGVRVRSMTEEFDTATATGRLMLTLRSESDPSRGRTERLRLEFGLAASFRMVIEKLANAARAAFL